jgi:S-adenosylmethionine:tRNA ribosyltransferase-isomerase
MEFEAQTLDYILPAEKIASIPLPVRHDAKLLVYKQNQISHDHFIGLANHIKSGSLLVFNNTKVFHARLHFYTEKGTHIEIFCLEPANGNDPSIALSNTNKSEWLCMVGGAKKWKSGKVTTKFTHNNIEINVHARLLERKSDLFQIAFEWEYPTITFADILQLAGELPLPPYMNRKANAEDEMRYQTVYAKQSGSVAAPTAGLHFTEDVMQLINQKNITSTFVTLHVGAGTFKPIKTAYYKDHEMHEELIDVTILSIENILLHLDKIIAVGTTSLRTIESLYWMGVKTHINSSITLKDLSISQWEAYELKQDVTAYDAISALIKWMNDNNYTRLVTKTEIMITPEYQLKIAEGLITNFHQPKSTLLLLIAAVTGKDWEKIYKEALENNYRFLSYGDSSLLMKSDVKK